MMDGCGSTKVQFLFLRMVFTCPSTPREQAEAGSSVEITFAWFLPLSYLVSLIPFLVDPGSASFNNHLDPNAQLRVCFEKKLTWDSSAAFLALHIRAAYASMWQYSWEVTRPQRGACLRPGHWALHVISMLGDLGEDKWWATREAESHQRPQASRAVLLDGIGYSETMGFSKPNGVDLASSISGFSLMVWHCVKPFYNPGAQRRPQRRLKLNSSWVWIMSLKS